MKSKIYLSAILITTLLFVSCQADFEDINYKQDTYVITDYGSLLNGILSSLKMGKNEYLYINNEIVYPQTQLASLTQPAISSFIPGTEEIWSNYYSVLPNFRELEMRINELDSSVNANNMTAILNVLLAYKTFKVTDLFGDIPFTEAGYAYQDFGKQPKFDSQEAIYKTLLEKLDWANNNLLTPTDTELSFYADFMSSDVLFNGDITEWIKFANSLRLRYALRIANVEPDLAGEIVADIINNNLPVFIGVNFGGPVLEQADIKPASHGYENTQKYLSYTKQPNLRMSTTIWDQFYVNDELIDPRPFYIFETNNSDAWAAFPSNITDYPSEGGHPYSSNREIDSLFYDKGEGCAFSPVNFFLVNDPLNIPEILMSGCEVHLLKAEAYYRGIGVPADEGMAVVELWSGVQGSMANYKKIMENSELRYGNGFESYIDVPDTLNFAKWQAATNFSVTLELIYAQRWIDLFLQPIEAFTLARQTMQTPGIDEELIFFRLPIPPSEKNYNSSNYLDHYGSEGDFTNTKIWWME